MDSTARIFLVSFSRRVYQPLATSRRYAYARSGYLTNFGVPSESMFVIVAGLRVSSNIVFLKSHIYRSLAPLRHTHENLTSPFLIAFNKWTPRLSSSSFAAVDEDPLWLGDTCGDLSIVNIIWSTHMLTGCTVLRGTGDHDSMLLWRLYHLCIALNRVLIEDHVPYD